MNETKKRSKIKTLSDITWTRKCPNPLCNPSCKVDLSYVFKTSFVYALKNNCVCVSCNHFRKKTVNRKQGPFKRDCPNLSNNPKCYGTIYYTQKKTFNMAGADNKQCIACSRNKIGKPHTEATKKFLRDSQLGEKSHWWGKKHTIETIQKLRRLNQGNKNPMFGKRMSIEERKRISNERRIYNQISKLTMRRQRGLFWKWLNGACNGFEDHIELTLNEFKLWIACQFKDGMNWKNYGQFTWHIDHKIPLCKHNLTTNRGCKLAWNYKNLQPLSAFHNLSKGGKLLS